MPKRKRNYVVVRKGIIHVGSRGYTKAEAKKIQRRSGGRVMTRRQALFGR